MQNGLQSKRSQAVQCSRGGTKLLRCWCFCTRSWSSCWWLWCAHRSGHSSRSRGTAAARSSCGGTTAASWSFAAGGTVTAVATAASWCLAARSAVTAVARWCCTARSCTRRLSTAVSATGAWLTTTTVACLCITNDQNDCQQGSKREHHLADHIKLLNRPRNFL